MIVDIIDKKRLGKELSYKELKFFFIIVIAAVVIITVQIVNLYSSTEEAFRHAFFTVASIISTTVGHAEVHSTVPTEIISNIPEQMNYNICTRINIIAFFKPFNKWKLSKQYKYLFCILNSIIRSSSYLYYFFI